MENTLRMKRGLISFGIISGIITTLSLIVGLDSATASRMIIIAGILLIAIADSASDSLELYLSEKNQPSENKQSPWLVVLSTFAGRLLFSFIFIIPFLIFTDTKLAVMVCILLGILIIALISSAIAQKKEISGTSLILKNGFCTCIILIASYYIGQLAEYWIK